jgi:uncharacterized protein YdhG (YjbR/CyaY superfamily)
MTTKSPERSAHFPAIEKKYGEKMSYWFKVMKEIKDLKYPEQIAYLKENYGFSQTHANALVLYSRGSTTSKRFQSLNDYLKGHEPVKQKTVKRIFRLLQDKFPNLELVMAWNQPMLKLYSSYIFGLSISKNHLTLAPFQPEVLKAMSKDLAPYEVNKKTFKVPIDWEIDEKLLYKLVRLTIQSTK